MSERTAEDYRLISIYGQCEVCGAPRTTIISQHGTDVLWSLTCTADSSHPAD